ncbi:glycosyltransferase family 39 protein [Prochlorococcus sp. AH-716-I05]|nr:glycosyltransferase family 39 protein [Prochlorococcus sp. AH-716-I05]
MKLKEENLVINKRLVFFLISILLLVSFSSIFFIENHSLVAHDESLYANRAKLIIDSNNWFTPFEKAHHKTIGSYWLIALSFKIFGISEFSARLPSYIFSILSSFLLFKIIKDISSLGIGLISIFTLSSSFLWFSYGRYCSPDTLYIFLNLLGILFLLKITNSSKEKNKNKFLFLSGLFLSLPFFVRSYLQLLPLVSIFPLIYFKIKNLRYKNTRYLIIGFFIGLIPLIIFYCISYQTYGVDSLIRPYLLLQGKTLTENNIFEGFLFYPRNLILLSTPFFIFLINGTKYILKNKSREIQILFVFTPFINIVLLMLTASKYSHYGLFAIPLLASNASFGIYESFKKKSNGSKMTLRIFGLLMMIISSSIFLVSILNFHLKILIQLNLIGGFIIFLLSLISMIISLNIIYKTNSKSLNLNYLLSIFFIQIFILNILFINGIIGNPNNEIKDFIYQPDIRKIINNNEIFIIGELDNKNSYLFKFYLPEARFIKKEEIPKTETIYGIINDKDMKEFNYSKRTEFINLKEFKDINLIKIN